MENFGSAAQLFPAFSFYKNLVALIFRSFSFFQLSPASPKFPKFSSLWFSFSSRTAATAAAFPAFWRRPSHIATGVAAQVGMASLWDYARLVKFGRNGKIWKP